mgnify:CR=1 FL=1|jgi:hypothetical protein
MATEKQPVENKETVSEATANPMADAPKKNAVASEPSHLAKMADHEDLGKAVTSPTDSNPDSTKNTKQVSGDPQQKSQGAADAMQKVKEEEEAKKEKEEVKEGEMPQAALDALKKKQDKKEEKSDDKEKEEGYGKMKKEEVEETLDLSDDVKALIGDENLTEDFKAKAATIFEAAVKSRISEAKAKMEKSFDEKLEESTGSIKAELVEKVDSYLNYVVETWMKENEIALERGIKGEIAEDFISGLKKLFEDHYIDVPDEKYNVLEDQAAKIEELKGKLNEEIEKNVELSKQNGDLTRSDIVEEVSKDLTETQKEKFNKLAEEIEFSNADEFAKKVKTIKESYFNDKKEVSSTDEIDTVAEGEETNVDLSKAMSNYAAAISKTKDINLSRK